MRVLNPVLHAIGMSRITVGSGLHSETHGYSKGGPLAVTDANLILGRLVPDYFPKIFGKSEKEPLDIESSRSAFDSLIKEINASVSEDKKMGLDEIVYGYG